MNKYSTRNKQGVKRYQYFNDYLIYFYWERMQMMDANVSICPCVWRPVSVGCITPLQACTVVYCAVQRVMAWEGACKHSSNITAVSTSQCYHHHHQCDTPGHCQMSPVWVTSSHVSAVSVSVETSSDCILQSFHCQLLLKL